MKRVLLAAVCHLLVALTARAETSVWQVTAEDSTLYLGGTVHMLRGSDYPLPEEFDKAYGHAQAVVLESDPDRFATPEVQQSLLARALYPEGESLDKVLSPQTRELLRRKVEENGIPFEAVNRLKPSVVFLTLLALELQKTGGMEEGVDLHFHRRAVADGKMVGGLESAEEQVDFLLALGEGHEDEFIRSSLRDLENLGAHLGEMISDWRRGNEEKMYDKMVRQMRKDFPGIYEELLLARNRNWLPKVESYLRTPEREFILVGVAHLVGREGLVAQLKKKGYEVRKLR